MLTRKHVSIFGGALPNFQCEIIHAPLPDVFHLYRRSSSVFFLYGRGDKRRAINGFPSFGCRDARKRALPTGTIRIEKG